MTLLAATARSNHLIDDLDREHLRHHSNRHHIRQSPRRLQLHPTSTRQTPSYTIVILTERYCS